MINSNASGRRPTRPLHPTPCRSLPCSAYHSWLSLLPCEARPGERVLRWADTNECAGGSHENRVRAVHSGLTEPGGCEVTRTSFRRPPGYDNFVRLAAVIGHLIFLTAIGCSVGWQPFPGLPGGHRRNLVGDPSTSGPFRFQLKIPAGARVEAHKHSIDVHVKVLSGSLFIIVGEPLEAARARKYRAGSSFVLPAHAWHVEWWDEPTILEGQGVGPMETIRREIHHEKSPGTVQPNSPVRPGPQVTL